MLSIQLADGHEWWVPGQVFERLFLSALENDQLALGLEAWRHVADANGGLSLADMGSASARELKAGLRAAATAELIRLGDVELHSADRIYKVALEELLAITR